MIGRLTGVLLSKRSPTLLLDVGGVGYEIDAPLSTFASLPELGATTTLHTHLVVREDAQLLYGFASERERSVFRHLLKVSGVGAKLALAVLSGMEPAEFIACVRDGDTARLVKLPGVGKKTAERLIVEMRDRFGGDSGESFTIEGDASIPQSPTHEAVAGLVALGYKATEAERYVAAVSSTDKSSEDIIRDVLKSLVK